MDPYLWVTALFVFLTMARAHSDSESDLVSFTMPCGCQAIQNKLDQLEDRVSQMFNQNQNKEQCNLNGHSTNSDQLEQRVSELYEMLQSKTDSTARDYSTVLDQIEQRISQKIDQLHGNFTKLVQNSDQKSVSRASSVSSASENNVSVQYITTKFGSNWIVILERIDGSVSFERSWKDYRNGFGTAGRGFWLGLEKVHQLTKAQQHELVVEVTASTGEARYARYDRFEIGSEQQQYPLISLGKHSGSAGDGLSLHLSVSFSTFDHGSYMTTSKAYGNGGWWFYGDYRSYLTGRINGQSWAGIWWGHFKTTETWTKLKNARMMIRAI